MDYKSIYYRFKSYRQFYSNSLRHEIKELKETFVIRSQVEVGISEEANPVWHLRKASIKAEAR